jgi:hypothetical protein
MFRLWKAPVIAAMAILTLAPIASAQQRQRVIVRRVIIVPTYDPFFDPFYDPYYYRSYRYAPPTTGDVKLKTDMKNAAVYVDGGFAGTVHESKRFSLAPGTHTIELRDSEGQLISRQTVNVMLGRTTTIDLRG